MINTSAGLCHQHPPTHLLPFPPDSSFLDTLLLCISFTSLYLVVFTLCPHKDILQVSLWALQITSASIVAGCLKCQGLATQGSAELQSERGNLSQRRKSKRAKEGPQKERADTLLQCSNWIILITVPWKLRPLFKILFKYLGFITFVLSFYSLLSSDLTL